MMVTDGELGSIMIKNSNATDIVENKKKKSSEKTPSSGENLNPPHLKDMETAIVETCSGSTTATDNTASKRKRKRKRKTNRRRKSKNKNPVSGDIMSTCESMQDMVIANEFPSTTKVLESRSVEIVSGKTETPDAKMVPKGEELTKSINDKLGSSATTIFNANGTVKEKNKLKSENKMPTKDDGTVSGELVTSDAKTVSKGEGHTMVADGELVSIMTINPNASGIVENTKNKSSGKNPSSSESLNLHHLKDMKTAVEETCSGTTATESTASKRKRKKKRKRKSKNKNPVSGDILSACESMQDMVIANECPSTTKVLESRSVDIVSSKTETLDAKMMPEEEELTKSINGKLGSSETTILNVNGTVKKKKKRKSKNKRSTTGDVTVPGEVITSDAKTVSEGYEHTVVANGQLDSIRTTNLNVVDIVEKEKKPASSEILNPPHFKDMKTAIDDTCVGTNTRDNTASKKRKRHKSKNKNPASGDSLSTCESMQDMVIAKEGSSTTKGLESRSVEIVLGKTEIPDAKMVPKAEELTKSINGKLDSSATTILNVNGIVKEKKKLKSQNKRPTIGDETVSSEVATSDAKTMSEGCEHTIVANGQLGSTMTTNLNVADIIEKEKKPASSEILNPPHFKDMKTAIDETCVGTNTRDNTASKKRKRHKSKSKNPTSGDALSTCESMQDMVIAKEGSSTTKGLESRSVEIVLGKTETPDANMMPKEEELTASKRRKRHKSKNENPALGDILSSCERMQDMVIANECASTTKGLESRSAEIVLGKTETPDAKMVPKGEELTESINGKMGSSETPVLNVNGTAKKKKKPKSKDKRPAIEASMSNAHENTEVAAINVIPHVATLRRKLLIFDVNGLIADVVYGKPKAFKADINIQRRAIFKRPFLDDFLRFCFERFDIAIWSSRAGQILKPVVNYLFRDQKHKLLFVWNASSCTKTKARTLENKHKFIVFKDLRKIWQRNDAGGYWVKGTYDESNTLLVDDSPYKALLNPKHTGIFPMTYSHMDRNDNSLGPNGDLRIYVKGLATADDVRTYVEQHPFGQRAIDETNPDWVFYSQVVRSCF